MYESRDVARERIDVFSKLAKDAKMAEMSKTRDSDKHFSQLFPSDINSHNALSNPIKRQQDLVE